MQTGGIAAAKVTEVQFSEVRDIALESEHDARRAERASSAYRIVLELCGMAHGCHGRQC